MNVRAQIASVFHLDKCIGCHTCSLACKNIWTDRPGAEYMWWNNVETKPGTGFPVLWEDQEHHRGGWTQNLRLRSQNRMDAFGRLFYNPNQPGLDDYYEPWTYDYRHLFNAPQGHEQPTAVPISQVTGDQIELKAGPNWDDDLSGSPVYAANDPNLQGISNEERKLLFEIERVAFMYLPRICNHCVNPACVAACPSGALYKRGEDGIVLVNQEVCKGWRACIPACPYKKVYFNWRSSKSEKCLLCYPRLESGQAPACFHSCVGRIRYLGVLLYDADRIEEVARAPQEGLVAAQRSILCNPHDPEVIAAARRNAISDEYIESAQRSPVYKYVVTWKLALPLHSEFRTLPMLYYVPPLLPVMGKTMGGTWEPAGMDMFTDLERMRLPIRYLANLFAAGNEDEVKAVLRKLMAVRYFMRAQDVSDAKASQIPAVLKAAGLTGEEAQAVYTMTTLADRRARYGIPPMKREESVSGRGDVERYKGSAGLTLPPGPLSND